MRALSIPAAFLRRDFKIDTSYRTAFLLQIGVSLVPLAIFFYLGKLVDSTEFAKGQDLDTGYFGFAAVGLSLFTIMSAAVISLASKIREEQTTGTFEALMSTPTRPTAIIISAGGYDLLKAFANAVVFVAVAVVVFGLRFHPSPGSAAVGLLVLVAALGLFVSLGALVAALTVIFKRAFGLVGLLLEGLALLGGVYFPIDVLPEPVESIAAALPFTWALDLFRAALLGGDIDELELAGLVAWTLVLLPAALIAFRLALRRARQTGTLAQY